MPSKILVVDDRVVEVNALIDGLKVQGWQVAYAPNGEAALQVILIDPPDLIICDWDMPDMTGPELMEQVYLTPSLRDIPFILSHHKWTMDTWSKPTTTGITAACHAWKPYNLNEVVAFCKRVLNND